MDPITHTLVGTSLASMRLGRTTRYASAALIVGANLPDIDVLSYFAGSDAALGFRRGWTHGVLALALLPALLGLALGLSAKLCRPGPATRPLSWWRLFALAYLAVLTHPALDWLNTYGMRWWMPFDGTWYYGDSMFIVDPWLWLLLGGAWLLGRRPTPLLAAGWALVALPLLVIAARSALTSMPSLAIALGLLLVALLWRRLEPVRRRDVAAAAGLAAGLVYILAMVLLHDRTEASIREQMASEADTEVTALMVGPTPADPFVWEFVVERGGHLRSGSFSWLRRDPLRYSGFERPVARTSPWWPRIRAVRGIEGFLGWARFPWLAPSSPPEAGAPGDPGAAVRVLLLDARYQRQPEAGFGAVEVDLAP